jgi:hypothetical protein
LASASPICSVKPRTTAAAIRAKFFIGVSVNVDVTGCRILEGD